MYTRELPSVLKNGITRSHLERAPFEKDQGKSTLTRFAPCKIVECPKRHWAITTGDATFIVRSTDGGDHVVNRTSSAAGQPNSRRFCWNDSDGQLQLPRRPPHRTVDAGIASENRLLAHRRTFYMPRHNCKKMSFVPRLKLQRVLIKKTCVPASQPATIQQYSAAAAV